MRVEPLSAPAVPPVETASKKMRFTSVAEWLRWQETLNPRGIDLGLDRCRPVASALALEPPPYTVISVAGTNGKGSCVTMLDHILHRAGYRVGGYTSPQLRSFNETIRVSGQAIGDDELMLAFQAVDEARGDIALTWFEFRTLAAAYLFSARRVDIAVMEVGLGGRLDAVNLFDAEVSVITSVGVDHRDWLGDSRDAVGREKAGICRAGRPAVCGDPDPPPGLIDAIETIGARLYLAGRDFRHEVEADGWRWIGPAGVSLSLPRPGISGVRQFDNASAALATLELLQRRFPVEPGCMAEGLQACRLPGRVQILAGEPATVLDVAHNPDAARALADTLRSQPTGSRTLAVFAMYADKDIEGVARALDAAVDAWYAAPLPPPRGASAEAVALALSRAQVRSPVILHDGVGDAVCAARRDAGSADRVVVFGSFETVRQAIELET